MRPVLIGLTGKMGAGKTTLANMICDRFGGKGAPLASAMKDIAEEIALFRLHKGGQLRLLMEIFHWVCSPEISEIMNNAERTNLQPGVKNRAFLQWIGTDFGRRHDPDVWVRWLIAHLPDAPVIVVDDVRFPNEVRMIEDAGGRMFRVERPELDRWKSVLISHKALTAEEMVHPSETSLDNVPMMTIAATEQKQLEGIAYGLPWNEPNRIQAPLEKHMGICCSKCMTALMNYWPGYTTVSPPKGLIGGTNP